MGAAVALPAVIATPIWSEELSARHSRSLRRRNFIAQVSYVHCRGRLVATKAMAMDLNPEDCLQIQLSSRDNPAGMPVLTFEVPAHPGRRILVSPDAAYMHGPV